MEKIPTKIRSAAAFNYLFLLMKGLFAKIDTEIVLQLNKCFKEWQTLELVHCILILIADLLLSI